MCECAHVQCTHVWLRACASAHVRMCMCVRVHLHGAGARASIRTAVPACRTRAHVCQMLKAQRKTSTWAWSAGMRSHLRRAWHAGRVMCDPGMVDGQEEATVHCMQAWYCAWMRMSITCRCRTLSAESRLLHAHPLSIA
eukprot:365013-Chlamydomonas_euryale.AAC.5